MADQGRTTRKIRQGKVEIDYEESSLVVHYDLELVRTNTRKLSSSVRSTLHEASFVN